MTQAQAAEVDIVVYRSSRHALMFVYLPASSPSSPSSPEEDPSADLSVLPEALLTRFGTPVYSLSFKLTLDRKLAMADPAVVLQAIQDQGFYLQLPPTLRMAETPDARNPHER